MTQLPQKLLILLTVTIPCMALAQINGKVMLKDSKPMTGVVVSDGKNCTTTNQQGEYTLPDNPSARFVFVTKPSQYYVLGRHYKKIGSPDYNFILEKSSKEEGNKFSFIHITDSETFMNKQWIDNLRDWCATNPTAFIIHTGDICYERGLNFHGRNVRSEQLGTDVFYTVGNHDLVKGEYGEKLWEDNFGPTWYSFDAGNLHFIALPMLGGDHRPSYTKRQIIEWLRNDLALKDPNKKVVMFNHDLWFRNDNLEISADDEKIDMAEHNLTAFLYGHWHSHYVRKIGNIMTYSGSTPDKGGIDHGTSCFRVMNVDANGQLNSRTRYTYIDGSLSSVYPAQGETVGSDAVVVNAYRTVSPTRSVRVCDNGKWYNLSQQSDWSWSGKVDRKPGERKLLIEAKYEDGSVNTRTISYTFDPKADGWVTNVRSNIYMVQPVVRGSRLFTATIDDDNIEKCYVAAFDTKSGKELWQYKTDNSVKNTIAADDKQVYALDANGVVYAINAQTGKLAWRNDTIQKGILPQTLQGVALVGDTLYAGQARGFAALNTADGTPYWQNTHWGGGEGATATITTLNNTVLSSGHWNGLYAHNTKDGSVMWKNNDSSVRFRDGSATPYEGLFYLASASDLMILDPVTGKEIQRITTDLSFNVAAAPLVTSDVIYVATSTRGIAAFDRKTLKKLWGFNASPAMFYTVPYSQDSECSVECSPVMYNGTIIFGANDGYLYGVNSADGASRFKRWIGSPVTSTPTISDDNLYVTDFAGNILKIKIPQ